MSEFATLLSQRGEAFHADLLHKLTVTNRVQNDKGRQAIAEGRVVSRDEAEKKVKEWLKSSGPNQR